jgi:hypothetical protein
VKNRFQSLLSKTRSLWRYGAAALSEPRAYFIRKGKDATGVEAHQGVEVTGRKQRGVETRGTGGAVRGECRRPTDSKSCGFKPGTYQVKTNLVSKFTFQIQLVLLRKGVINYINFDQILLTDGIYQDKKGVFGGAPVQVECS